MTARAAALVLALGVARVAGQTCGSGTKNTLYFSAAEVIESYYYNVTIVTASALVFDDGKNFTVDIKVLATKPDYTLTDAELYNTSGGSGVDPDLDVADVGNVVIVQQDNAPVPNDRGMGGILYFAFNFTGVEISFTGITLLDIENNETTVEVSTSGGSVVIPVPPGGNGNLTTVEADMDLETLLGLVVNLDESGAVYLIEVCAEAPPDPLPDCPGISANVNFSTATVYYGNVSTVSATVVVQGITVDVEVLATKPDGTPTDAKLYDTLAGTGVDPDLDVAALGNVVIVQQDNAPVPNDRAGGGTLLFTFTPSGDYDISFIETTILDIENDFTKITISSASGDEVIYATAGPNGNIQNVGTGSLVSMETMKVKLNESGAVFDIDICITESPPPRVCPPGFEQVTVDFSMASVIPGVVSTVSTSVDAGEVTVDIEATATKPDGTPTDAELYDTSAETGVDPDLDVADLGNAVIVQQDNAPVPNDRGMGGSLNFTFSGGGLVSLYEITLLDIENDFTTVETSGPDGPAELEVPAGEDGNVQVIEAVETIIVTTLIVDFNESGAVAEMELCVQPQVPRFCPPGFEQVIVDFSMASVVDGAVSTSVDGDGFTVDIEATATKPDNTPTDAELYNTSAGTGVDPDLDVADMGNAVIVQQDNAPVPNDRGMGGSLLFTFSGGIVTPYDITLLDIENNLTTVEISGQNGTEVTKVPAGVDGDVEEIQLDQNEFITNLTVNFDESGAVAELELCILGLPPDDPPVCPLGTELVTVDFSLASVIPGVVSTVSTSVDAGVVTVDIEATATKPDGTPTDAELYDTSAGTGVDPDLDAANMSNAVIVQQDNAPVPNDRGMGGSLLFTFSGGLVSLQEITLLDIENNFTTVVISGPDGTVVLAAPAGEDGNVKAITADDDFAMTTLTVNFNESGAVAEFDLCVTTQVEDEECPGEVAIVDFSLATVHPGVVSIVSTSVTADGATVGITATATKPDGTPTDAELYDTSAGTGVDPDLDIANLGNAVIVQQDNAPVPNDRGMGGTLLFTFNAAENVEIDFMGMTILDIENNYTTIEIANGDPPVAIPIIGGDDGNVMLIGGELLLPMSNLAVNFNESGAVAEIKVCIDGPVTMANDPHIHTHDGKKVDIYLPVGQWVPLMASSDSILKGRVFSKTDDLTVQWFDGIALEHHGQIVFNVTIPHDVKVGEVNAPDAIAYLDVRLDGQRLVDTDHTYVSADGAVRVTATKTDKAVRKGIYNDRLAIETSDFTFTIVVAKESNKKLFDSVDEQLSFTHMDLEFPRIDYFGLRGPIIELIYKDMHKPSAAALAWKRKENVYSRVDPDI